MFATEWATYEQLIVNILNGLEPLFELPENISLTVQGLYHRHITKNYEEMERYYTTAIERDNVCAMNNFGYYQHITKNYKEMERLYTMAIERGNVNSMGSLGYYHRYITKNYREMERFYTMAIERGNAIAMHNLACYHQDTTKNYGEMERYYTMTIERNVLASFTILSEYYLKQNKQSQFIELFFLYPTTSDPPNWKDLFSACTYKVSLYTALEKVLANRWTQEVQAVLRNDPYVATFITRRIISTNTQHLRPMSLLFGR